MSLITYHARLSALRMHKKRIERRIIAGARGETAEARREHRAITAAILSLEAQRSAVSAAHNQASAKVAA